MEFRSKETGAPILAKKISAEVVIGGEMLAVSGDYLAIGEHGQHELWPAAAFENRYEPTLTDQLPLAITER